MIGAFRFQPFKLSLALLGLLFSSHCFSQSVGPLLFTRWNQGCNYNAQCPNDAAGPCARVYTGCGATGFAQILRYHAWPPVGTSSNTYSLPAYGSLSANFSVTNYPWLLMPNYLSGPSANVAQLMFHSGVALSMMYGPSGSGSYFSSQSYALKHYFRYALDMKNEMKFAYSDSAWKEMLKAEMLAFRPVSYYGTGPSGGHLWVVDGYRNSPSEQFHMNWGWGGLYDGWYDLLAMNPGGAHYTTSGMLRRIHPAAPVEGYPDTIFVSASAQTPYFEITSDSAWTTTSSQPWATPSVSAGTAGYFQHSLTIAANPLWSQRTATVTIQRGNLRDSIFVIQAALPPSLSVTPALVSIGFSSGSQLITVFSDSAWTTSTADSWLSIVSGSGSGNGSFTINYAANPGLNPRTGIVVATRNGLSRTVTINQNGSGNMWCTPIVLTAGVNTAGLSNVTLNTINRTSLANEGYVLTGDSTQLWQDSTYTICLTFVGTVDPAIWIDYNIDGDFLDPGETILSPTSPWFPSNNTTRCTTFTVPSTATEGRTRMRVYVSSYNPNLGPITGPCFTADRGGDAEDYTIIIKNPRHLNVTPSPLSFTFAGGTQNLAVDCDSVWNLISYPAWVNPLPLTGSGNGTVAVTVPANSSTIGLSGNMQFTRGGITRNVPVTQTGADTILNAMPDTVFFTSAASLNPVTVTSNVAWNVSGGATWFSINATSGNGNSLVDVTASQNLSFSRREDSIRFYSGTHQKWVHIIQDSTSAVMTVVPSPLHFPWEGGTDSVQVTTGAGWTAFINDPWVSISQNSGTGNARIYVSADTNFVTVARTSTVNFTNGLVTVVVTVIQDAADTILELHPDTLFVPQNGATMNLMAHANVPFNLSAGAGWISPLSMTGNGDSTYAVTFQNNLGFTQRIDSFVAVSGSYRATTVVLQDSNSSVMYVDPTVLNFVITGGTQNATLYTNGSWTTTISDPRISLSPTTGTDTTLLNVTVADNTGNGPWTGTVTFSNGLRSCVLTVNQDGGTFVLGNENEVKLWPNPSSSDFVQVSLVKDVNATFRLFDLAGKEIKTITAQKTQNGEWKISGIPGAGAWLLEVSDGTNKVIMRIIRE